MKHSCVRYYIILKSIQKSRKKYQTETYDTVLDIEEPGRLADMVASHLPLKIAGKQEVLEIFDVKDAFRMVSQSLAQ